ncbi:MAG: glycosyltransferase family 2 protein [Prochlorococcus marinus XMU1422]|nr:glycosyltransferase family 2 protein [Prochlorococcus marinus XMU1421]MBO7013261.1 glycosyltransferase family 2 protein [Prochlorococcus marinus XMU1422]MCR8542284.1 glycosyltransferase family 2 protein [Prochlorococcus marinus XMU1423]
MKKILDVFIPTRNNSRTIIETLESISSQTINTQFNCFLLDNMSSDNTIEIVSNLFPEIQIIGSEKYLDVSQNFSRAFNLAQSEFFTICHADDIYLPKHFENLISVLKNQTECLLCYSTSIAFSDLDNRVLDFISPTGGKINETLDGIKYQIFNRKELIEQVLINGNSFPCPSIIYRKNIVSKLNFKYGQENKKLIDTDDLYNLLEISKSSDICVSINPSLFYRRGNESMSFRKSLKFSFSKSHLLILKDIKKYPVSLKIKISYFKRLIIEYLKSIFKYLFYW